MVSCPGAGPLWDRVIARRTRILDAASPLFESDIPKPVGPQRDTLSSFTDTDGARYAPSLLQRRNRSIGIAISSGDPRLSVMRMMGAMMMMRVVMPMMRRVRQAYVGKQKHRSRNTKKFTHDSILPFKQLYPAASIAPRIACGESNTPILPRGTQNLDRGRAPVREPGRARGRAAAARKLHADFATRRGAVTHASAATISRAREGGSAKSEARGKPAPPTRRAGASDPSVTISPSRRRPVKPPIARIRRESPLASKAVRARRRP